MKSIILVTRRMIMGGIEKSLISMLNSIPKEKYNVTVLVMGMGGELENEIPDHVKIESLYGYESTTIEKIWNYIKYGNFIHAFKTGWYTLLTKMTNDVFKQEQYHSKMIPVLESEYDLAIAYHTPASFPVVFVMNNIKAKSKVAWIHADVSKFKNELKPYKDFYKKFNKIFCVSKYAMDKFNHLYPDLKDKTSVFYNILDRNQIINLSDKDEGFNDQFDGFRILTVGRITKEKGQDIIPLVLMKLKREGYNVRWYCIGDGEFREEVEKFIEKYSLEDYLILLGTKTNPYAYFKQCNIYVQPSRHEGYCISLGEARAFCKPIIATDFVGAKEQIESGYNGLIVEFDENEIFAAIKTLLNNENTRQRFEKNLQYTKIIEKSDEIKKLLDCVG